MIKKKKSWKRKGLKREKARTWHLDSSVVSHAAYDWDQPMRGAHPWGVPTHEGGPPMRGAHPREMEDFESYTRKI